MPKRDWTKTGMIGGYAEYVRKNSGALFVLVIRRDDSVLAFDPKTPANGLRDLVLEHIDGLAADLPAARTEKRAARLQLGELHE